MIDAREVTGLVLAGGRGSRMGGIDKGLRAFRGVPLALHAMQRLAPQVSTVLVNANRHRPVYESMGMATVADRDCHFAGPLSGMLAGLECCPTPYLVVVPCDAPWFPLDLTSRLAAALLIDDAEIACATATTEGRATRQPVFCLLKTTLAARLRQALDAGQRKVGAWTSQQRHVDVQFDDPRAFVNLNTLAELHRLEALG